MLIANETVGAYYKKRNAPFIYRIHEKPSEEKAEDFLQILQLFGYHIDLQSLTPKEYQKIIKERGRQGSEPPGGSGVLDGTCGRDEGRLGLSGTCRGLREALLAQGRTRLRLQPLDDAFREGGGSTMKIGRAHV